MHLVLLDSVLSSEVNLEFGSVIQSGRSDDVLPGDLCPLSVCLAYSGSSQSAMTATTASCSPLVCLASVVEFWLMVGGQHRQLVSVLVAPSSVASHKYLVVTLQVWLDMMMSLISLCGAQAYCEHQGGSLTSDIFSLFLGDEKPDCPSSTPPPTLLLVFQSSISKSSTSFLTFVLCLYFLMLFTNIQYVFVVPSKTITLIQHSIFCLEGCKGSYFGFI
jgi:hypothetical protein